MSFKKNTLFIFGIISVGSIFQFSATDASAQVSSHGGGVGAQCVNKPVAINFSEDLKVQNVEGKNQVLLRWAITDEKEAYLDEKQNTFMTYLKENPKIGRTQNKLKNVFANYVYDQFTHSENPLVKTKFKEALTLNFQSSQALKPINVNEPFYNYYPYLFIEQLKTEPTLSKALIKGMKESLTQDTINPSVFIPKIASNLKVIQESGPLKNIAACMARVIGTSNLSQFKPDVSNNIYGSDRETIQTLLNRLKDKGKIQPILETILNDRELVAETKAALEVGINTVIKVWSSNSNVQNLIHFYETDSDMRALVNAFFESKVGSKLDKCVQDGYGSSLLELTKETYLSLLIPRLETEKIYSDQETMIVIQAAEKLLSDWTYEEVQIEAQNITQNFINDYLMLEEKVKASSNAAKTPFTDYYREKLENYSNQWEGVWIEIQRDGQVIQRINNPNITQFTDYQVPQNNSGQIISHQYNIVTKTQCDSQTGEPDQVAINPTLKNGASVEAVAEVEIRLKDSQTKFLMERLDVLLNALIEGKTTFNSIPKNPSEIDQIKACDAARADLLATKTSEKLFPYVLNCFADGQIDEALQKQLKDNLNPLIRFLELNQFADPDKLTAVFLAPMIEMAQEEYKIRAEILKEAKPLIKEAQAIIKAETLENLTPEQRHLIKCGGQTSCSEKIQKLMEKYFLNASHAADIIIEVYDETGKMVLSKEAHTDIFGQVSQLSLGELKTGINYEFKVKLKAQPYALAKVSRIRISEAIPVTTGKPKAVVILQTTEPFFYGNFDNSNNIIDLKDIEEWSKLVQKDPKKWSAYNVDGFTGIDLMDASLIQTNWGEQAEELAKNTVFTLSQLMKVFGYSGGDASAIYAPNWLLKLQ